MQFKGNEISSDLLKKAQQCKSAKELTELAEESGIEVSLEEAEALLDEYSDVELDEEMLDEAAGGGDDYQKFLTECNGYCANKECRVRTKIPH